MLVYYFLPVWILICSLSFKLKVKNNNLLFLILVFLYMFPLMAFRNQNIGTDLQSYLNIFDDLAMNKFNSVHMFEKNMFLYSFYNVLLSLITTNSNILIFSNSLIICILLFLFLYRNCKNSLVFSTFLLIISYSYFTAFNIARQFIAIGIVSNAFYYIYNQKVNHALLKYCFCVLVASCVHFTSLITLVLVPVFIIKKQSNFIKYSLITPILIFLVFSFAGPLISTIIPSYSYYFDSNSQFGFQNYDSQGRTLIVFLFYLILLFVLYIYSKNNKIQIEKEEKITIGVFFFYTVFGLLGSFSPLLSRMGIYFSFSLLLFIPLFCNKFVFKEQIIAKILVSCVLLVPFVIQLEGNYSGIIPYETFF